MRGYEVKRSESFQKAVEYLRRLQKEHRELFPHCIGSLQMEATPVVESLEWEEVDPGLRRFHIDNQPFDFTKKLSRVVVFHNPEGGVVAVLNMIGTKYQIHNSPNSWIVRLAFVYAVGDDASVPAIPVVLDSYCNPFHCSIPKRVTIVLDEFPEYRFIITSAHRQEGRRTMTEWMAFACFPIANQADAEEECDSIMGMGVSPKEAIDRMLRRASEGDSWPNGLECVLLDKFERLEKAGAFSLK